MTRRNPLLAGQAAEPVECYLREGEPLADHDLTDGVVCARCYGALADESVRLREALRAGVLEIESALESLAYAAPEAQHLHLGRIQESVNEMSAELESET